MQRPADAALSESARARAAPRQVSENASWSTKYYSRLIRLCLQAAGAPRDLVQIVTGFGEAGHELTKGGVDTLIFVGSVGVGRKVQEACGASLTPVILELGGKDPFIVCDDANLASVEQAPPRTPPRPRAAARLRAAARRWAGRGGR
jgi:acyl-CoA reductase-like NAD-dependent aldehyde dehydrogenase